MGPEKKLFRRSFMLVSALALSVSLAACGDEEEVAETPAEPAVVEPVEPEVAVEPEVEPEAEVVEAEPVEPVAEAPVAETPPTGVETQTVVVETVPATGAAGGAAATGGTATTGAAATTGATQTAGATLPFSGRYAPSPELCEAVDDPQIINFEADRFTAGGNQFEIQNVANEGDQFRVTAGTSTGAAEEVAFTPTQNGFEMETADGNFTYVFCPAG